MRGKSHTHGAVRMPPLPSNNKGFTLVEVIVASMVLFTTIAAGALILKTTFFNMGKVTATAYMAETLKPAADAVKAELRDGRLSGGGRVNRRVTYSFTAEQTASRKNIVPGANPAASGPSYGSFRLSLYQVNLILKAQVDDRENKRQYSYQELVWKKEQAPAPGDLPLSR